MSKPFFTIVIPTLNEENYLPRLLEDLSNQTFPKEQFEVIHVDGDSDDKTVALAKSFNKKISIKSIVIKKRNVSTQRNKGAQMHQANGSYSWMQTMNFLTIF